MKLVTLIIFLIALVVLESFFLLLCYVAYQNEKNRHKADCTNQLNHSASSALSDSLPIVYHDNVQQARADSYSNFLNRVYNQLQGFSKINNLNDIHLQIRQLRADIRSFLPDDEEHPYNADGSKLAFTNSIKARYPNLPDSSVELAYLIFLRLSPSHIASVMGISVKSVSMARYRLRKRLSLSADDDLELFLSGLLEK